MLIFDRLLHTDPPEGEEVNLVRLPFDARQRSRLRITIEDGPAAGQAAGIDLPRGTVTRGGALLADGHGRWLRVGAQPEALLAVRAAAGASLAALAYHLGNRHVPVEIAGDTLYLADDHVLAGMVTGLGGTVERVTRPFEPEGGAYGGHDHAHGRGHAHGHDHDHDHDHDHGHAHGHLHGHEHGHEHGHPHAHENADDPGLADAAGPGHRHGPAHDPAPPDRRHSPRIHDLSAEVRR